MLVPDLYDFLMHFSFVRYVVDAMKAWNEAHATFTQTPRTSKYEALFSKKIISAKDPKVPGHEWSTLFHFLQVGLVQQTFKKEKKNDEDEEEKRTSVEPIFKLY